MIGASYVTWRLDDKTVLGLSLGLAVRIGTKPDDTNWAGKYEGITTYIFNVNATPMLSYEIARGVSVGVGIQDGTTSASSGEGGENAVGLGNFKAEEHRHGLRGRYRRPTCTWNVDRVGLSLIDRSQGRGACRARLYWQDAGGGLYSTS